MDAPQPAPAPAPQAAAAQRGTPVDAVRDIWRAGEKLVRGNKLYGVGHANTRVFVTDVLTRLTAWFASRGPLEVVLTPTDVLFEGEKVLRGEGVERNFAHPLAISGVVRLKFEPGLEAPELERLFALLQPKAVSAGDELTTRLWTETFTHVKWMIDSELERADPKDEATANWLRAAMAILQRARADTLERTAKRPPNLAELARDGLCAIEAVPGPPLDKVLLTREAYQAAVAETKADADMAVRSLAHLIEAGREPTEAELKLAGDLLVPALTKLAANGEVAQAERLLGLLDRGPLDAAARAKVLEPAADALARTCVAAVKAGKVAAAAAANVLKRLGPGAADALVESAGGMPAGPDRLALAALLPAFGERGLEALAFHLAKMPEDAALELLGPVASMKTPTAIDVYDAARQHPSPAVVKEGARHGGDASQMSPGRAAANLTSPDARRRQAAVAFLRKGRGAAAAPAIEALIDSDAFKGFGLEEKKELFAALAELSPKAALPLARRLFAQKALLGGAAQEESRIAAALALGRLGDQSSRDELEAVANGRGHAALKEAAAHAMRQIDISHREKR
jgi:hypothetical protein